MGAIAGATIVEAMRKQALATTFGIATDATGMLVQPQSRPDKERQPCRRAHFCVQIADADHVFCRATPGRPVDHVSGIVASAACWNARRDAFDGVCRRGHA